MVDTIKSMISSPLDGATTDEIKNLIKSILATFTTSYVKQYALSLVKKIMDDASADPGPDWHLMERPPRTDTFLEGWVEKEGGFFTKKMNKRYFVVRPDYFIDYFTSEDEAKKEKGKKKGSISLCGYWVNEDANNGLLQRLTKLAEKMGVDLSGLPKPKQYPPNTMELHHSRRQAYYIHLEDTEEFKKWLQQMRTCAWRAYGFKNKDPVHTAAFHEAIRATRSKLGRWGWWSFGGTEEQVLSDLISDEIDWTVMGKVYSKLNGSWTVRNAIRTQVLKAIDKLVIAGVTPAWKAMSSAVEELRPKIEPKIKEVVEPIGKAKLEVKTKIKDACMSIINPLLQEHVVPHLSKVVAVIQSPMTEAFDESFKLWNEEVIGKFTPKDSVEENKKEFRNLDYFPHSWKMYDITRKTDVMYDPLWALNVIFDGISPWSLIWKSHDVLREKMDNAIYTYEQKLLEAQGGEEKDIKGASEKIRASVFEDFKHDAKIARVKWYRHIIKQIVMPPFNKVIFPATEAALDPLNSAIPDPMQQFLDINEMFESIVVGIIDDSIDTVLGSV